MKCGQPGDRAAESFGYLLTELPLLKNLSLEYSKGIDAITYMPSTTVNNTIVSLTIWLLEAKRLMPLLYRFQRLKALTLYSETTEFCTKMALPPQTKKSNKKKTSSLRFYCHHATDETLDLPMSELDENCRRLHRNSIKSTLHYGVLSSFISIDPNDGIFYSMGKATSEFYRAHRTSISMLAAYSQSFLYVYKNHLIISSSVSV
ncbi:unnamed protein product [Rotaria sp. Silwood2]|nr:unnamed protein product [Rotaria sp. Silwood2]